MPDYDDTSDVLDLGKSLKRDATLKKNLENMEKLKEEKRKEDNKASDHKTPSPKKEKIKFTEKYRTAILLTLILLVAVGIRFHAASMPLTDQWAQDVVEANLQTQVSSAIDKKYSTLSDEKKEELIQEGTTKAINADQNKEAVITLSEQYKGSYQDPDGYSYLYEIDPYYFYDLAQKENAGYTVKKKRLLPFIEFWFHRVIQLVIPDILLVHAIFYLPLVFTILATIALFFIVKEVWDITAAFCAGLFFVMQPLMLEFSMLGFVDTNMLNILLILCSGLFFLLASKGWEHNKKQATLFFFLLVFSIIAFSYAWSAWYISILVLLVPVTCKILLWVTKNLSMERMKRYTSKIKEKKSLFFCIIFCIIIVLIISLIPILSQYDLELFSPDTLLPTTVKKYLHLDYEDPFGSWPDTFTSIKELKALSTGDMIKHLGGSLYAVLAGIGLFAILYKGKKEKTVKYLYALTCFFTFYIVASRAIRILPYFIPFFSLALGVGVSIIVTLFLEKVVHPLMRKEEKIMQMLALTLLAIALTVALVYPLVEKIQERSNLMPVMDDAIYNSAQFIKENSDENAIINTWWDRGTFYTVLAERTVHLHSQPHMPRTYWMSSLYVSQSDTTAKNTLNMLNCNYAEYSIYRDLNTMMSETEAVTLMHIILNQGIDADIVYEVIKGVAYEDIVTKRDNDQLTHGDYNEITRRIFIYLDTDDGDDLREMIMEWLKSQEEVKGWINAQNNPQKRDGEGINLVDMNLEEMGNYVMTHEQGMIFILPLLIQDDEVLQEVAYAYAYVNHQYISQLLSCGEDETYVVVIDDMMPRFTSVQYFAAWNFEAMIPEVNYPYTDLNEGGCVRTVSGAYCEAGSSQMLLNFTTLDVQGSGTPPEEVFLVYNNTVQHKVHEDQNSDLTLIVYQRDGYWKALLLPSAVADSLYVRLMVLDGYGFESFEKVFEEVHVETSWVKVYKVKW